MRFFFFLITVLLIQSLPLAAQLTLPAKSPRASVSNTIGLTKIHIDYSSPAVRGREIWGELVPYGTIWRAGANQATTISFSTAVQIEGKTLAAGEYALFFIPKEEEKWTLVLNQDTEQWGAYYHNPEKDILRVDVNAQTTRILQERLEFTITGQGPEEGYLKMAWADKRVYIRLRFDTYNMSLKNIEKALADSPADKKWEIFAQAADYLATTEKGKEQAVDYARKSTDLNPETWNWFIRARAHAALGDYPAALQSLDTIEELVKANPQDEYYRNAKPDIELARKAWQQKQ